MIKISVQHNTMPYSILVNSGYITGKRIHIPCSICIKVVLDTRKTYKRMAYRGTGLPAFAS